MENKSRCILDSMNFNQVQKNDMFNPDIINVMVNDYSMKRLDFEMLIRQMILSRYFPLIQCLTELTSKVANIMCGDNVIFVSKSPRYIFIEHDTVNYVECEDKSIIIASVEYLSKNCDSVEEYITKLYNIFECNKVNNISIEDLKNIEIDIKQIYYDNDMANLSSLQNKDDKRIIEMYNNREIPLTLHQLDCDKMYNKRTCYIEYFGYTQVTKLFAYNLAQFIDDKKCLEIMAGKGCLSYALKQYDIDIIPTDNYNWGNERLNQWLDVEEIDCLDAIEKYGKDVDYIIIGWTPYGDPIIEKVFEKIKEVNPDLEIIFIGESEGGCTGTDDMFDIVEEIEEERFFNTDISYFTWYGLHDRPMLLRIKQ